MNRITVSKRLASLSLLGLILVIALVAAGARSAAGPRLWTENGTQGNRLGLAPELAWQSLRMPPAYIVERTLTEQGRLPLNSTREEIDLAVQDWYRKAAKTLYFGPNPLAYQELLEREDQLLRASDAFGDDEMLETPPKNLLGVTVEFAPEGGEDTFERPLPVDPEDPSLGCSDQEVTFPALGLGDDPPPSPVDNFSFYKENISIADYESAFFETGPDAGYGVVRPDLGGIDLSGYSLNNYLAEMSDGAYQAGGGFLHDSLALPRSHEFYGHAVYAEDEEGNCLIVGDNSDANYVDFVLDTMDAITAAYEGDDTIDWSEYDADGDQVIDLLVIIHAGYAWQSGGGVDRLSTSSSGFTNPYQIVGFDTPDDESDDYFVQGFNVDPEQLDVGGIQEEFEHQFGLPDIYTTDLNNSNAFWGAHSSGVWGGELGGTRPVGHNLWQDWVLGWRDPQIIHFNDPQLLSNGLEVAIGRARYTPEGTEDGVIVRLPDQGIDIPNLAGEGTGWYSQSGDLLDNRVYRSFDLSDATSPIILSFDSYWDIEEDWDYGLIEFSNDEGATWITMPDENGILSDEDPNGVGVVIPGEAWGLTGEGEGTLTFDLSQFEGDTLWIRFRYLTDVAVANFGWQIDNILLTDNDGTIYENDLEEDFSDWTNEGWGTVPLTNTFTRYYLLEWRDDNGFDQSLNDPYQFQWSNPDDLPLENYVDRLPATTAGLQVSYRDTSQGFDYTLGDSLLEGQTIGTKFGHLVVDSHFWPKRFDYPDPNADDLVGVKLTGRVQSGDALFGHTPTNEWYSRLNYNPNTGEALDEKTWPSEAPKPAFHDSYGYYPGLFFSEETGFVYFVDNAASVALPASGPYSTRITDVDGNLLTDLFGATVSGFPLGTGNPGDDHVHFGLHVEVVDSSDPFGTIRLWNKPYQVWLESWTEGIFSSDDPVKTSFEIAENIGGKIEDPFIVVGLPDGVNYVEDSGFGGLMPLPSSLRAQLQLDAGNYLVWMGDDIWTGASVEPFGFEWTADEGLKSATFEVSLYRQGTSLFQTESFTANEYPYGQFLPIATR